MDTLTHALSGALAARLLPSRPRRASTHSPVPVWQVVTTGFAAAAFPDLDFVLGYVSELAYLRGHRGVTHSLLLLPAWALLVAWLLAALFRLRARHGAVTGWRDLYLVACVAIFVHILGDLITQFGTMILAPLSDRRFGWGTTFIIDLGFTGIIVAGLLASALWRRSRVPAAVAATALVAWVGLSASARVDAIDVARAHAATNGLQAVTVDAIPRPASPFNWTAVVFDGERYHYAHINTRRSEPLRAGPDDNFIRVLSSAYLPAPMATWHVAPRFGDNGVDAIARRVWAADEFSFFRWFAMFPVLDHAEIDAREGWCASFRDLRFDMPGRERMPFRYGLCGNGDDGWRLFEREGGGRRWIDAD